jgi:hypothetical protein
MACFRQSKRRAANFLSMIVNQPASAGWMVVLQNRAAAAVLPAYEELAGQLPTAAVLHGDESPTKQGQGLGLDFRRGDLHVFRWPHQPSRRRA